jgi:hypothetical protein
VVDLSPYATAGPMLGVLPTWLSPDDAQRISAYALYEGMYRNVPDAYKIIQRGSEQNPILVPAAKTIVEATNRFLAKDWTFVADPRLGTDSERALLTQVLTPLFRRERVWSKFAAQKRYGLIRGDTCWHILADPLRLPGKRISIMELDPATYFPIFDENDDTKRIGCHIVEIRANDKNEQMVKRQTYRKDQESGVITHEITWWELGAWDDRYLLPEDLKKAKNPPTPPLPLHTLPPEITALPVYHIKNDPAPSDHFGVSELAGLERIAAAVSQAISDEEIELALAGLGLYVTTSGPPVDESGNETTWKIGPGYVAEIDPEATWERVSGVASVEPNLDHIRYLEAKMKEASGTPDIAIGDVSEVRLVESGIALAFKMAPILAKCAEKEQEMLSIYDQMLYDISRGWLPAYEQINFGESATAVSIVSDPMPINREAFLKEVGLLIDKGIISVEYARVLISEKLGLEFPTEMGEQVVVEQAALAAARNTDPFEARVMRELGELGVAPT